MAPIQHAIMKISSATFHQAKHQLDEIIMQIKLNHNPWSITKADIIGGSIGLMTSQKKN